MDQIAQHVTVTREDEFSSLLDQIHDGYISVDELFSSAKADRLDLAIYYDAKKGRKAGTLRITGVKRILVEDTERIDTYDLNKISYDRKTRVIEFIFGAPLRLELSVKDLNIEFIPEKVE